MAEDWLVIFSDVPPLEHGDKWRARLVYRWILRWLKPGFRHVHAMRRTAHGGWIVIDPNGMVLTVKEETGEDYARLCLAMVEQGHARALFVTPSIPADYQLHLVFSCVSVIKHLLGIDCPALTPWQLYLWVLKNKT